MTDPVIMWLMVGAGLIVLEGVTAPGIGLFLAGFGAISAAIVVKLGLVGTENTAAQFAWFFALTTVWAAVLWKPLKKFRTKKPKKGQQEYNDMIGSKAIIATGGLTRGETGQAKWSGTVMSAVLANSCSADFLPEGTQVTIAAVSGNVLSVTNE